MVVVFLAFAIEDSEACRALFQALSIVQVCINARNTLRSTRASPTVLLLALHTAPARLILVHPCRAFRVTDVVNQPVALLTLGAGRLIGALRTGVRAVDAGMVG